MSSDLQQQADAATSAPPAPPTKERKRDVLFLPPTEGLFSFGFEDDHLPIAQNEGVDDDDDEDDENEAATTTRLEEDKQGVSSKQRQQQPATTAAGSQKQQQQKTPVTCDQVAEARRNCSDAGMNFFGFNLTATQRREENAKFRPISKMRPLNREAHTRHVRSVFDKTRQDAAIAELIASEKKKKKRGGGGDDDDDEDDE